MAIRVRLYEQPGLNRLDLTTFYRRDSLSVSYNAEETSTALGSLIFDDPDGVLDIPPLHRIDVWDDEAPVGSQLIYVGSTTTRELTRGANPFGRHWLVSMEDRNTLLHRRLLTDSTANRPAETDLERIAWLMATDALRPNFGNPTYISSGTPTVMSAANYQGQSTGAVVWDCMQQSGKNAWAMTIDGTTAAITSSSTGNPTTITTATPHYLGEFPAWVRISGHSSTPNINGEWIATPVTSTTFTIGVNVTSGGSGGSMIADTVGLWYDFASSTQYQSALRISNVLGDVDLATTFPPSVDATLRLDPTRIYTGVLVSYGGGGSVYRTDSALQVEYIDRDIVAPAVNVTTASIATARAERYLADNRTDEEVVSLTLDVPTAKVTALQTGMRADMRFSHLPGWETFRPARILTVGTSQPVLHRYQLRIEASGISVPLTCEPLQWAHHENYLNAPYEVTLGAAPTNGNTLVAIFWRNNVTSWTPTDISGGTWTQRVQGFGHDATQYGGPGGQALLTVYTRVAGASESPTTTITPGAGWSACSIVEIPGTYVSVTNSGNVTLTAGQNLTVTRTSTGSAILLAAWAMQRTTYAPADSITPGTGVTEIRDKWALDYPVHTAPHSWIAWTNRDGAGSLSVTGAPIANPNLDKWGVFAAGLLFDCT